MQMRVTPQPAVDNAQMKMMKFMPVMFVLFYYNWSCALSLYSTINGLFTICQQLVVNRGARHRGHRARAARASRPRTSRPARR